MTDTKLVRKTIEFHPDMVSVMDEIQQKLGLERQLDAMQKALQVLAVILDHGDCFYIPAPEGGLQKVVFDEIAEGEDAA